MNLAGFVVLLLLLFTHPVQASPPDAHVPLLVDRYENTYDELFQHYAHRFFGPYVDWRWFKAQAVAESMLDKLATSPAGARGLMQLLPSTYQELRLNRPDWGDIHAPRSNIEAGMYYNRLLYRQWKDVHDGPDRFLLMLASYNAGFYRVSRTHRRLGDVRTWEDIEAYVPRETRGYVARIRQLMEPDPRAAVIATAAID